MSSTIFVCSKTPFSDPEILSSIICDFFLSHKTFSFRSELWPIFGNLMGRTQQHNRLLKLTSVVISFIIHSEAAFRALQRYLNPVLNTTSKTRPSTASNSHKTETSTLHQGLDCTNPSSSRLVITVRYAELIQIKKLCHVQSGNR
jgi:hypothetical protein